MSPRSEELLITPHEGYTPTVLFNLVHSRREIYCPRSHPLLSPSGTIPSHDCLHLHPIALNTRQVTRGKDVNSWLEYTVIPPPILDIYHSKPFSQWANISLGPVNLPARTWNVITYQQNDDYPWFIAGFKPLPRDKGLISWRLSWRHSEQYVTVYFSAFRALLLITTQGNVAGDNTGLEQLARGAAISICRGVEKVKKKNQKRNGKIRFLGFAVTLEWVNESSAGCWKHVL